ncbi:MAG TPA: nucleotide exchange factor GrpE [Stellaceae bacterium]|nr:nucleotide exchange factor GrpE [Stellaceae bacterium]
MNGEENNGAAPEPEIISETREDAASSLEERLAAAVADAAEAKDRVLRALAETENLRRRAQREREEAVRYAAGSFAKDLLSVADNLHRALASAPSDAINDEAMSAFRTGVEATERELLAAFDRHGIRRIEPKPGDRFDHNFHQALFEVEESDQPPGTIAQILQPGYAFHDRLLRPALVGVAKGG